MNTADLRNTGAPSPQPPKTRHVFVLSLDGGGLRGAFPAMLLKHLEAALLPTIENRRGNTGHSAAATLADGFNMIAGTSTGSIIATGLALGKTATSLSKFYQTDGRKIFSKRGRTWSAKAKLWARLPKFLVSDGVYSDRTLNDILRQYIDGPNAGPGNPAKTLADVKHTLVINTMGIASGNRGHSQYDPTDQLETLVLAGGKDADTVLAPPSPQNPPTRRDTKWLQDGRDVVLWEAVRASCAGPTFLAPYLMHKQVRTEGAPPEHTPWRWAVDGGTFANNPAVIGARFVREVIHRAGDPPNVRVHILSIGTGRNRYPYPVGEDKYPAQSWRDLTWINGVGKGNTLAKPIINLMMLGQSESATEVLQAFPNVDLYRLEFDLITAMTHPGVNPNGVSLDNMADTRVIAPMARLADLVANMVAGGAEETTGTPSAASPQQLDAAQKQVDHLRSEYQRFITAWTEHGGADGASVTEALG